MEKSPVAEIPELEKRQALHRLLSSNAFHRSDQLKSLLRYICEREISDGGTGLDEYAVAVEALGRPSDYSALEDGTVRNRIHHLRRRLEQYYAENGDDPIQVLIPKGSYCPRFQRHLVEPIAVPPPEIERPVPAIPPTIPKVALWKRPVPVVWTAALCLLVGLLAAAAMLPLRKSGFEIDPVLAEAWGPLLAKNSNPLICVATAAQLTLMQRAPDSHTKPLVHAPDLIDWYQTLPGLPPAQEIYLGPSLTSPFWGDVAGVLAASLVFDRAGIPVEALPESAVQLPALNKRNLLIFGRPGFSKTIDLYFRDKPFRVRVPDREHTTVIWNVEPKPGEPAEYDAHAASASAHGDAAYGLITVMPGWGNPNLRTVVFSGTLSPGTQAAAEYFSSPKQLRSLLRRFRQEGHASFPASYQVVVRANVFNTSALDVEYVTHRVIAVR